MTLIGVLLYHSANQIGYNHVYSLWVLERIAFFLVFILLYFVHQVAPHNTFYSQLAEHVNQVGIDCTVNRWDEPLAMGMVDPHGSLSCFARASDVEAPSATCLDPSRFTNFLVILIFVRVMSEKGWLAAYNFL